jgi:hypothetical protein
MAIVKGAGEEENVAIWLAICEGRCAIPVRNPGKPSAGVAAIAIVKGKGTEAEGTEATWLAICEGRYAIPVRNPGKPSNGVAAIAIAKAREKETAILDQGR